MKYIWSRMWENYTPMAFWDYHFGKLPPLWLVNIEIWLCELFPDSWYDQND
ncbi:hypothetical protein UFOVP991_21 [uncultured Caudovirales phage]|uniref:Uncharacterized protein n=1 Tax=uncultured Caudovirales phage TaxID=2100421 RepID=A0A6J5RT71_9CAUD|nr:hypothetical protein UFOVP991_21 [uncultured Caudovirales phage]CAB4182726.1 hypothetical protein UFOVP1076_21 [uncultured Caudovirales phage]CAB4197366.1 hypothetical protein UFOVP1314_4 [uncultured Caudovirales phage]CAB4211281.1 hypothetical protein UFOVP1427_6 [uncultured Caudovirales phage]CAB5237969.1 hypothetical protein UFOVP1523_10 [uncultured Caudovirales phage]